MSDKRPHTWFQTHLDYFYTKLHRTSYMFHTAPYIFRSCLFLKKQTASGNIKTLTAFTGTVLYIKTRRYYTYTIQSRDAKSCASQARMRNQLMWIYACRCRYHSSEDARFCVHTGRTPIIHLRLIVSHSSFFRTAASILYSAFSRYNQLHLRQKQNTIWLTAALNKNRSLMTIRV